MLRLALIGCPEDSERYARLAARVRGARFVAVVARDGRAAHAAATALGSDFWADRVETLLAKQPAAFDAAIIGCPSRFDTAICHQLATAGKHLLVDAPLAASAEAARATIGSCSKAGVRLMVGQAQRFQPSLRVVKDVLDARKLGELGLLRIHRWEPPGSECVWRLATREIDIACWLFGRAPEKVHAVARRTPAVAAGPDFVQLHLGFGGGTSALIDLARTLPPGDSYYSLSVIGSAGAAYADDHRDRQLLFGRGQPAAILTDQGDACRAAMVQEFVDAVTAGREPAIPGAEGVRALEVAEACARSAGTSLSARCESER